ncbi:MAG: hypothetical protein QOF62_1032 [Pyrinomonadaceae bacterium]|jgi:hypothetical protein|nr:hypothetical protein [Pyrinomonadaceae bacterium]
MHCIKCGSALPDGAGFCPGCGQSQKARASSALTGGTCAIFVALALVGILAIAIIVGVTQVAPALVNHEPSARPPITDQVVLNWHGVLKDGERMSWQLPAGNYRLELTASNDGDTVEWIGGNCPATQPMTSLSTSCQMPRDGQLLVTNPTTLGLGAASMTTVKVTRVGIL